MQVCTKCIAQFGFRFSDKSKTFETDEELYEHMENVHGMVVMREGETEEQAEERCTKKVIVANRAICQCEECKILRFVLIRHLRNENSSIRVADEISAKHWIQPETERRR